MPLSIDTSTRVNTNTLARRCARFVSDYKQLELHSVHNGQPVESA